MARTLKYALLALPLLGSSLWAQLQVAGTNPQRYSAVLPMQPLTITFAQPVQPASVTAQTVQVFGQWSGPMPGRLTLAANGLSLVYRPLRPWFPGESITLSLTSSILAQSGQPLTSGYWLPLTVAPAAGTRQFTNVQTIQLRRPGEGSIGTYGIYAGDIDRDGSPDITAMNEIANDLRHLTNSGCGTFGPVTVIPNPGQWPSPNEGADFDGDGWLDLATGNQNGGAVSIYLNDQQGGFRAPVVYPTGGYVHGIAAADFNGDGWCDVAATNTAVVCVFLNLGNGTFGAPTTYDVGNNEDNVGAADVNEDGHPDLVVGNFSTTMAVLLGNGDGTFTPGITRATGGLPFHQALGDMNGDHHVDALFANRGTNTFGVLFGDGAGNFAPAVTYPVGQTPAAIDVGDLDGDGALDVAVSNYASGNYSLWFNRGDGVFVAPQSLAAVQSGSCCTLVDFDRDGVLDLIGADENADVAILWRQQNRAPVNTQPASCSGVARVNQHACADGYGGTAPVPVPLGSSLALGLSGDDNGFGLTAIGIRLDPGVALAGLGVLGVDTTGAVAIDFVLLDSRGEGLRFANVPTTAQVGWVFAYQGLMLSPTLGLTNPQMFVLVP